MAKISEKIRVKAGKPEKVGLDRVFTLQVSVPEEMLILSDVLSKERVIEKIEKVQAEAVRVAVLEHINGTKRIIKEVKKKKVIRKKVSSPVPTLKAIAS